MKKHSVGKKATALVMSGVLAIALAPVVAAPTAIAAPAQATAAAGITDADAYDFLMMYYLSGSLDDSEKAKAIEYYEQLDASGYEMDIEVKAFCLELCLEQAKAEAAESEAALAKANKKIAKLQTKLANAQTQLDEANAAATAGVKITKVTTSVGMQKVKVTWKVSKKITGAKYAVSYKLANKTKWKTKTVKKLKANITGLKANKTYNFRVRAVYTVDGTSTYSKYSKTVSAKPLPTYAAGKYKVTIGLNLRTSASTSSSILRGIPANTTVKVTAITVSGNEVWGKTKYDGKTGYIAMKYTKAA